MADGERSVVATNVASREIAPTNLTSPNKTSVATTLTSPSKSSAAHSSTTSAKPKYQVNIP